jgi:parallel beta-helix repeat protein
MKRGQSKKKQGISAIVATVLLILITIAGIGIIWGVVLPLFKEVGYLSYSDIKLDIVTQGYTVYDPEMHFAFVQVARGNDNLNLTALEVVFNINGSSVFYRNYNVPNKNEKKIYTFNFSKDGIDGDPNKVSVAPVFNLNGREKIGELLSTKEIPNQKIDLSAPRWEEAKIQALNSIVKENYSEGGGTSPVVSCTADVSCDDRNSCTTNDKRVCSGGALGVCTGVTQSEVYNNGIDEDCNGWAELNSCTTLSQVGVNYSLTNDIIGVGPCIKINASNITLEGNGHWIIANKARIDEFMDDGSGIYAHDVRGITIKNMNVRGVAQGLYFERVNNSLVTGVTSSDNGYNGIWITESSFNRIENNDFSGNLWDGIWLHWDSDNNTIKNNIVRESGWGLYMEKAEGNIIEGNDFCSYVGVKCGGTYGPPQPNQIDRGNLYTTEECEPWLGPSTGTCPTLPIPIDFCSDPITQAGKAYKLVKDLTQTNSQITCLNIEASNIILDGGNHKINRSSRTEIEDTLIDATYKNNITIKNIRIDKGYNNVYLNYVTNSLMKNVTSKNALYNGFNIWNSQNITFEENTMTSNEWDAIWFYFSNNNTIRNNNMSNNGWGLWFEYSQYNKIGNNRICNTELDYNCKPSDWDPIQNQTDLGGNTYSTQNECGFWVLPSVSSCN